MAKDNSEIIYVSVKRDKFNRLYDLHTFETTHDQKQMKSAVSTENAYDGFVFLLPFFKRIWNMSIH